MACHGYSTPQSHLEKPTAALLGVGKCSDRPSILQPQARWGGTGPWGSTALCRIQLRMLVLVNRRLGGTPQFMIPGRPKYRIHIRLAYPGLRANLITWEFRFVGISSNRLIPASRKHSRRDLGSRREFFLLMGIFSTRPNHIWAKRDGGVQRQPQTSRKFSTKQISTFDKTGKFV